MTRLEELRRQVRELEAEEAREHWGAITEIQSQARKLGRSVMAGGMGWREGGLYGAVQASYPDGSSIARPDSWRCHHFHETDVEAMECALEEVRRLAMGGEFQTCSTGPGCPEEECARDRLAYARRKPR